MLVVNVIDLIGFLVHSDVRIDLETYIELEKLLNSVGKDGIFLIILIK